MEVGMEPFLNHMVLCKQITFQMRGLIKLRNIWLGTLELYLTIIYKSLVKLELLGMLFICWIMLRNYYRARSKQEIGTIGALVFVSINACFSYPYHSIPVLSLSFLYLGIFNNTLKSKQIFIPKMILAIVPILICFSFINIYNDISNLSKWKEIAKSSELDEFKQYEEEYASLYKKIYLNHSFFIQLWS